MADQNQPKKKRSGGPKTPEGKERSRWGAVKHGARAVQSLILPDETMEEYTALRAEWLDHFQPEDFDEKVIVDELISAHWLFKRAKRRLMETEFAVAGPENVHPADWTAEDEHKVELMQRYKTSAERSFYRALNEARKYFKEQWEAAAKLRKLQVELERLQREDRERQAREEAERGPQGKAGADAEGAAVSSRPAKQRNENVVIIERRVGVAKQPLRAAGKLACAAQSPTDDVLKHGLVTNALAFGDALGGVKVPLRNAK